MRKLSMHYEVEDSKLRRLAILLSENLIDWTGEN